MTEVRCRGCGKLVGEFLVGYYRTTCPRCHRIVEAWRTGSVRTVDPAGREIEIEAVAVTPR